MKKRVLLLVIILCLFNVVLFSIPYTTLGNINIPDAYILPHKMADISYTNYFVNNGVTSAGDYTGYDHAGSIRIGLFDRGELGVVYTSTAGVFGNLKLRIISETETLPAISFGITNIFSSVASFKTDTGSMGITDERDYVRNSSYFVISKSMVIITGIPIMDYMETSFHFGMGQRRFRGEGSKVVKLDGVFWGLDIKPSRYWGFDLELDSQDVHVGLNCFYKNFTLRAGIYEFEWTLGFNGDARGKKYAINLKYTLDKFSELKTDEKRKKTLGIQQRAMQKVIPISEETYDEDSNPLYEELEQIRQRRKQAEKELEEIKKLLQE